MSSSPVAERIGTLGGVIEPVFRFFTESAWARRSGEPGVSDFAVGNPHELPLTAFSEALKKSADAQHKDWFAYTDNKPEAARVVAESLREWKGIAVDPADVVMTAGAFAGLQLSLQTVVDPGDEVIFVSPPWFFYEFLIKGAGGVGVRVKIDPESFDLDVDAIEAAITDKTRMVMVNSPNNPTGKIYPRETLERLAAVLERASAKNGRTIYLISDEAYSRIVFDGHSFVSPARYYANTFLIYTYGKTLLTPGQRLGYIAMPPDFEAREAMRQAFMVSQLASGWSFPNALLQHSLADLEKLSIDIEHLQYKRTGWWVN